VLSINGKIKLYLITGFLGSGKTTLLQELLRQFSDKRVGLIINEFGKLGIDGQLVRRSNTELLEINNGSVFCSCLKGSFIDGLLGFSELPIDFLFVECSGLADPANIGSIMECVGKAKGEVYDYCGSICVADGCHLLKHINVLPVIGSQVASANVIVINKADLVDEEEYGRIEAEVRRLNPNVRLIKTSYCRASYAFLTEKHEDIDLSALTETSNIPSGRPRTLSLRAEGVFRKKELEEFLKAVSPSCYRVKGFFRLEEGWFQLDAVEQRVDFRPSRLKQQISQIVIISSVGDRIIKIVREAWDTIVKKEMILRI